MLSTVVHFLSLDCGSLILFISIFTFKFEFKPIGKLLKAFIGDGPFCSSGVVWGMTLSRKTSWLADGVTAAEMVESVASPTGLDQVDEIVASFAAAH